MTCGIKKIDKAKRKKKQKREGIHTPAWIMNSDFYRVHSKLWIIYAAEAFFRLCIVFWIYPGGVNCTCKLEMCTVQEKKNNKKKKKQKNTLQRPY